MIPQAPRGFNAPAEAQLYAEQQAVLPPGDRTPGLDSSPSLGASPYVGEPDVEPGLTLTAWRHAHTPIRRPGLTHPLRWVNYYARSQCGR
jgi:hypothetical protein